MTTKSQPDAVINATEDHVLAEQLFRTFLREVLPPEEIDAMPELIFERLYFTYSSGLRAVLALVDGGQSSIPLLYKLHREFATNLAPGLALHIQCETE